jgi:N-acetylneuraminate synthase
MNIGKSALRAISGKEDLDIAIIGKGGSISDLDLNFLSDKVVINVNDSEFFYNGDIGVVSNPDLLDTNRLASPSCRLYISKKEIPEAHLTLVPKETLRHQTPELMIERFFDSNEYLLEGVSIVDALKVANIISTTLGLRKRVYLFGFDFDLSSGFADNMDQFEQSLEPNYVESLFSNQEFLFKLIYSQKDRLDIEVIHVGNKEYSRFSIATINALVRSENILSNLSIETASETIKSKVHIVAEITTNHFGDMERLRAMILQAKLAGADSIKLQKRDVESFYSRKELESRFTSPFGSTFGEYREGLELSNDDFVSVDYFCKKIGIGWFASALDLTAFEFFKEIGSDLIKIPSTISEKKDYLHKISQNWDRNLVISTGMTDPAYEKFVLDSFRNVQKLFLLQCTSSYPAPLKDAGIGVIRHYRDISKFDPRIVPGYSSHDIGSLGCQLAVAAGAKMIEKHVKLGSVQWSHFDDVALDLSTSEFADFVRDVRLAEDASFSEVKEVKNSEHHKY